MPKLNRKQLFTFELAYPSLADQRRIVAYLDGLQAKVDELRCLQAATGKELNALMPSILAKAFAGSGRGTV
jgi:type I restriction enzyme, S subunit